MTALDANWNQWLADVRETVRLAQIARQIGVPHHELFRASRRCRVLQVMPANLLTALRRMVANDTQGRR